MTDPRLTVELATRVMGWGVSPTRFQTGDGGWKPRWRFKPLERLADSLELLESAAPDSYEISTDGSGRTCVRIQIAGVAGEAQEYSKPRALTYAVARAVGIDVEGTR